MENNKVIQKGFIYKIICNKSGKIYVGSTTKSIERRLRQHKCSYKSFLNGKHGKTSSFEIIEGGDCKIEMLKELKNITREDLLKAENEFIETIECINKQKAYTGLDKKEYGKQYRNDNKDTLLEYGKQYRNDNKDSLNEKKKQYYNDNKDSLNEKHKQYYEQNKEIINKKRNEKITCPICGTKYSKRNKSTHEKSKKHVDSVKTINNITINMFCTFH